MFLLFPFVLLISTNIMWFKRLLFIIAMVNILC